MSGADCSAEHYRRCLVSLPRNPGHACFRPSLLTALAVAGLLGGTAEAANAASFTWTSGGNHISWGDAANWGLPAGGAVPGAGDVANITWNFQNGTPTIGLGDHAVGTINLAEVGRLDVVDNGTFVVSALNIEGALNVGAGAVVTVGTSVTIGLGKAKGKGTLDASAVGITQSNGVMGVSFAKAATYDFSGGAVNGSIITFGTLFMLRGTGNVTAAAVLVGNAGSTMNQAAGTMSGNVSGIANYAQSAGVVSPSGRIGFSSLYALSGTGAVTAGAVLTGASGSTITQAGGTMSSTVTGIADYVQSGGTVAATGRVGFSGEYALSGTGVVAVGAVLTGGSGSTMTQAGGTMNGTVTGIATYTQSGGTMAVGLTVPDYVHAGGLMSGTLTAATYGLTSDGATSTGGVITASGSFDLAPVSGTAIVDARLSGTGGVVKSGDSTVVLTNMGSDFSGPVAIDEGILEARDDALPDMAAVTIADGATLRVRTVNATTFLGTMSGAGGLLVKEGSGTFTLVGDALLGGLTINAGTFQVGTGLSSTTASFDSAVIAQGATLYVAAGATLTIRIPKNILNNGTLTNNGTVIDDLDNTGTFDNNSAYIANVATNTGTINNNTPGVWTGNVETNTAYITNNAGATWRGNVETNSGHIGNAGIWEGDVISNVGGIGNSGTWTGDIYMNTYGSIYNDGAAAVWNGDVNNNTQVVNINGATWNGDIVGNNNVVFNQVGSTWRGDVVASGGGENSLAQIDNYGDWYGDIITNESWIFSIDGTWRGDVLSNANGVFNNHNDVNTNPGGVNHAVWIGDVHSNTDLVLNDRGGIWNGRVLGNSGIVSNRVTAMWTGHVVGNAGLIRNSGIWAGNVTGNSDTITNVAGSTWNGSVAGNGGTIGNDGTWTGDVLNNGGTIANGGTWTGNVASNAGTISTTSAWNGSFTSAGTVNAQERINGAFANSGLLHLTGSLAGITAFTNSGTVDMRGNGAGQTLSVATASFAAGSFYDVEIDPDGDGDLIAVAGAAALDGTVRVSAATGSSYGSTMLYTILTAGSIGGEFAAVTTDLAFLEPDLSYDATNAFLTLMRNDVGFADAGKTPNQQATAGGVESLGAGNPIYDAVLWLTAPQAAAAFDGLSGEAHASGKDVALRGLIVLADTVTDRVDQTFDALEGDEAVSSYTDGLVLPESAGMDKGVWGQFYGLRGSIAPNGSTAGIDSSTGGFAGGLDGQLGDWTLGAMVHTGFTATAVPALSSSTTGTDYGLGAYGGTEWGATRLAFGATYAMHNIHSDRDIAFPGFTDTLSADYMAATGQAFGTLSHAFELGDMSLTPYGSLAYVRHATDAFTETGGPAALSSEASVVDATFTTLGLGIDRQFVAGEDMLATASASLGWRHTFAGAPTSRHAFAGGSPFTVSGAPVAGDTLVLSAGISLDTARAGTFDFTYDGEVGSDVQSHALKGTWAGQF